MNPILNSIFASNTYTTKDQQTIQVNSATSVEQCEFLERLILENKFTASVEIGCAYGISSLAITDAVVKNNGKHTIIDKFEVTDWYGVGLELIEKAGYTSRVDFYEDFCYVVLPKLLSEGRKFDFAYIDSTKQFDWLMVDFFFLDKMLDKNGIIVFDDVSFPGIRKLLRYLVQFPDYRVYDSFPKNHAQPVKDALIKVLNLLPQKQKYLKPDLIKTDFELGINTHCVALQKMNDDTRTWEWHKDF